MQKRTLQTFKPIGKNLLVLRDEPTSPSGTIILMSAGKPATTGTVLKVGDKVDGIEESTRILFGQWVQQSVDIDGVKYLIMKQDDVLAIL